MRQSTVTRLLALALVLMMILSLPALADGCALCGENTGSDAYLCPACMLKLLTDKGSSSLEITGAVPGPDGSVTLCWKDETGSGPYQVCYELLNSAPVPFGWTAAQNVLRQSVTIQHLAPGVAYVFTVTDAAGSKAEYVYCPTMPENGNEIGAKIRIHTKLRHGENVLEYPFSASEIMLDNGKEHGLYMKLAYSMLRKTRNYAYSVTVEAPCGFKDVVLDGHMTLNYGKSETPAWGFIGLDTYFSYLERYYGGVPTGEYLVTMHFDGKPVYTVSFLVKE